MSPPDLLVCLRAVLDFVLYSKLVRTNQPYIRFLFVGAGFCVGLPSATPLRVPPCLSLTVPTAKPVRDFHPQVLAHAGHTAKKPDILGMPGLSWLFIMD